MVSILKNLWKATCLFFLGEEIEDMGVFCKGVWDIITKKEDVGKPEDSFE
ncbi:hypothetical protein KO465_03025 [Candidatus Micrarchaeota archaeon]|nr:hypothetical protein [Candidatus Micrarchaeota archaeon]